jgi:3-hydroxyisobutyryl-CoA hydrolase
MKVTIKQLRRGASMHIAECFQMEYRLAQEFLKTPDFLEGTAAKLIEKREPVWNPSIENHESLTNDILEGMFFNKNDNLQELDLHNKLTYYDYPHRTLSGLPTDKDINRIVRGIDIG